MFRFNGVIETDRFPSVDLQTFNSQRVGHHTRLALQHEPSEMYVRASGRLKRVHP
jgi:hypothetical protein